MSNYVIECTVSELTKEETKVAVKIVGTEGYAIKQGDKTYNVFCPKDMPATGNCNHSYIVDSETEFTMNGKFENILTQASVHGKKIRLKVSKSVLEKHIQKCTVSDTESAQEANSSDTATPQGTNGKAKIDIESISLLQK